MELDGDVLLRCIAGEPAAREQFARTYYPPVRGFLARQLFPSPTRGELDDLAQQVLWKALKAIGEFDPSRQAKLSTWLFTITVHAVDDWRKRRANDSKKRAGYEQVHGALTSNPRPPDEELASKRLGHKIREGLARLPEEQRAAFNLHHYEEVPVKEIAKIFDVSEGTVKTRLRLARMKMREHMKGDWDDYKG